MRTLQQPPREATPTASTQSGRHIARRHGLSPSGKLELTTSNEQPLPPPPPREWQQWPEAVSRMRAPCLLTALEILATAEPSTVLSTLSPAELARATAAAQLLLDACLNCAADEDKENRPAAVAASPAKPVPGSNTPEWLINAERLLWAD